MPEDRAEAAGDVKSALEGRRTRPAADFAERADAVKAPERLEGANSRRRAPTGKFKINTGNKKLDEKLSHKLENPELAVYKLQQTIYKFSFLLVPISIPFVALLFLWKRGFTLYDHGVFVLYSLTFMSLLAMAAAAVARLGSWTGRLGGDAWSSLAVPLHMYFQLQGRLRPEDVFSTLWRTAFLLVFCARSRSSLFMLAILWLGAG